MQRKQSSTTYPIAFFMVDGFDHITGKTGLTITLTVSKNGAAFGAVSGAVSELTNGWYSWAGNATDRNTLGSLAVHATGTGADPLDFMVEILSYDPIVFGATVQTLGAGSVATVFTINDGSNPIDGVDVWVSSDSAGSNVIARGFTNALGLVTLMLDPGTYYTWKTKAGYTFENPSTLTVV